MSLRLPPAPRRPLLRGRRAVHRPPPLSIRWRLTIWYSGMVALTLALFSGGLYLYMDNRLRTDIDWSSQQRAQQVARLLVQRLNAQQLAPGDQLILRELGVLDDSVDPFRDPGVGVRLYNPLGMLVGGSSKFLLERQRIPEDRMVVVAARYGQEYRGILSTREGPFYAYSRPVPLTNGQIWTVLLLTSMQPYQRTMEELARLLLIGTLLATAIAFVTGAAMAKAALSPMDAIVRTAQQINRERDLSRRIEAKGPRDEIGRLTETINDMLVRIEAMFDRQRQFMADVSHELRTPLTTIRGEVDLMQRSGRVDPEGLEAVRSEAERMARMVGELLLLARAEAELAVHLDPVELDTLLLDVYRQALTLAGDGHRVVLGHEDAATVVGDRDRLKQLLLNLVENALTYTPGGSTVTLALHRDSQVAWISVADDGPGIPAEDLERIFDRFYRVDKARKRTGGGTGLGLSIVQWIAKAHGGRVEVASTLGAGTTFTVTLPLAAAVPANGAARHNGQPDVALGARRA
jgi:heavy metal sensor kinase